MRTLRIVLLLVSPALTGGAMLAAQAVERTDVPARGVLRVTFDPRIMTWRSEEHTSELQSRVDLVCRLLLEKKKPLARDRRLASRPATPTDAETAGFPPPFPRPHRDTGRRDREVPDAQLPLDCRDNGVREHA